jgi:hypothetical protein
MFDKDKNKKYSKNVSIIYDGNKTIYKLYRDGKLVYIGVAQNETRK